MTRRTYVLRNGKMVEKTWNSREIAGGGHVAPQREFVPFHSHQIHPADPAIDAAGLKRTRGGDPIFASRNDCIEFQQASHGEAGSEPMAYDGINTKLRRPEWIKPYQRSVPRSPSPKK